MVSQHLQIHHIDAGSSANGPGKRYCIWLQGCSLHCQGCFNPQTHDPCAGQCWTLEALGKDLHSHHTEVEGITLTGGEPLDQPAALHQWLLHIRQSYQLPVLLFSGYTLKQIHADRTKASVLPLIDALICGPFKSDRTNPVGFITSSNQELHLISNAYTKSDFASLPSAEVIITQEGTLLLSGVHPLRNI